MDLKVVFVIVCLCAFAITSIEAGIPKCCVRTRKDIPQQVLQKVYRSEMQSDSGACNIPALILHVKDMSKPICAHPKMKGMLKMVKRKMKRNARQRIQ